MVVIILPTLKISNLQPTDGSISMIPTLKKFLLLIFQIALVKFKMQEIRDSKQIMLTLTCFITDLFHLTILKEFLKPFPLMKSQNKFKKKSMIQLNNRFRLLLTLWNENKKCN
jgi:hypothetical protein